ncbi:trigger factor [Helcococcus ovis]|uniref:Trigger factor n=1 Tax=Helcococcus ovis TaxID=72026 RepID=A0A4R9C3L1_9FIRM|nr:trigger factor [Helcococcus ovis]TFF66017.1 trigger factor [Helcococcus ovis]TFF66991.1 trigger factor [Helcococcus ovis]TFF68597.1 trigger factor [Helcococcus ovis]WNZ01324.1 trigger factor [Helcococcus ovis]
MSKLVSKENNKAVFVETVKFDVFKEKLQEAYQKNKSRFNIPGFRKGKAPRRIIEMNYGKEVFYNDALDLILPDAYQNAIEELKITPVSRPHVDFGKIEEGKDIELKFEVETYPEFELADYTKLEVTKQDTEVKEELVEARIQDEIQKNGVIKPVEREIQIGDVVNIDFEGFKDGVAFEGGKAEGYDLKIGSKSFIPGFEEGLIGKKLGEEVELNLTFPEEYQAEDLKGQEVLFKVKVNEVKEEVFPELDDDFVMDVSEFDTVDEYKESIRKELKENLEKNNEIELENQVIEEVIRRTEISVPNQMIEDQLEQEYHEYTHQISHMGIDMKTYFQLTGSSEEQIREQLRERAENKVKIDLILEKLVEEKEYAVSDDEVENEYKDVAKQYKKEDDAEFIEKMKQQVSPERIKVILQRRKAVDEFKQNVVFVDKKEEKEESEEK